MRIYIHTYGDRNTTPVTLHIRFEHHIHTKDPFIYTIFIILKWHGFAGVRDTWSQLTRAESFMNYIFILNHGCALFVCALFVCLDDIFSVFVFLRNLHPLETVKSRQLYIINHQHIYDGVAFQLRAMMGHCNPIIRKIPAFRSAKTYIWFVYFKIGRITYDGQPYRVFVRKHLGTVQVYIGIFE